MSSQKVKVSAVWRHFTDIGNHKVKCRYCPQIISAKGSSTGNLNRHLRTKHLGEGNVWGEKGNFVGDDFTFVSVSLRMRLRYCIWRGNGIGSENMQLINRLKRIEKGGNGPSTGKFTRR